MDVNFYNKHYKDKSLKRSKQIQVEYFLSRIPDICFKRGDRILDAGCGVGILVKRLQERDGVRGFGIDLSEEAVRQAKANGVKAKLANLEDRWPYKSDYFDCVFGIQVIEHLVNPDHFLREARRVLKANGLLILTTPNLAAWFNRIIFLFGFQPFFLEASTRDKTVGLGFTRRLTPNRKPLGHIRVFTLPAIKDLLRLNGFDVLENKGGRVFYLPWFMRPFDLFFSLFPSLSTELIVVARKL